MKTQSLLLALALCLLDGCASLQQALVSQLPDGYYETIDVNVLTTFGTAHLSGHRLTKSGNSLTIGAGGDESLTINAPGAASVTVQLTNPSATEAKPGILPK